jgi:hypothetical protein
LQRTLFDRADLEASLFGHYSETELDAAQVGVVLPHDYFRRRARLSEAERTMVVRSYPLEQAMVI